MFSFNALDNINIDSGGRGGGIENLAVTFLAGGTEKHFSFLLLRSPRSIDKGGVWGFLVEKETAITFLAGSARSTLIRGDGGEASKILQLLSSRVVVPKELDKTQKKGGLWA